MPNGNGNPESPLDGLFAAMNMVNQRHKLHQAAHLAREALNAALVVEYELMAARTRDAYDDLSTLQALCTAYVRHSLAADMARRLGKRHHDQAKQSEFAAQSYEHRAALQRLVPRISNAVTPPDEA